MVIMERDHYRDSGTPENYIESVTFNTYKCQPKVVWTLRMRLGRCDLILRLRRPPEIEPDPCFTLTIRPYGDELVVTWSQIEIDIIRMVKKAH